MIPQPFVKGAGERVFFGPFEYPSGADLIYDFGNPVSFGNTSAFSASNAATTGPAASVTASFIPYFNPGAIYPTYSSNNGGVIITREGGAGTNYLQWDWKSTAEQTNVLVYAPNGNQSSGTNQWFPRTAGASSIELQIIYPNSRMFVNIANSSNVVTDDVFGQIQFDTGSLNGRNGWNTFIVSANESNIHNLYVNTATSSLDTTTITRTTSGTQTTQLGLTSNARIMAFLQYPKLLTPKEVRQINKVFSQRFFT
jgi:hypothetical protein